MTNGNGQIINLLYLQTGLITIPSVIIEIVHLFQQMEAGDGRTAFRNCLLFAKFLVIVFILKVSKSQNLFLPKFYRILKENYVKSDVDIYDVSIDQDIDCRIFGPIEKSSSGWIFVHPISSVHLLEKSDPVNKADNLGFSLFFKLEFKEGIREPIDILTSTKLLNNSYLSIKAGSASYKIEFILFAGKQCVKYEYEGNYHFDENTPHNFIIKFDLMIGLLISVDSTLVKITAPIFDICNVKSTDAFILLGSSDFYVDVRAKIQFKICCIYYFNHFLTSNIIILGIKIIFKIGPDFSGLKCSTSDQSAIIDSFNSANAVISLGSDIVYTGYFHPPIDGQFMFKLCCEECKAFIDNEVYICKNRSQIT
ncbi:hypothetical protein RF11_09656 [Thelohanellus kitauei]|uniref:Uncharacterized protein n=1 Tax=Thelohanellus kitauei TaxID=669202 RepID=A0A0C2N2B8_THEKT|nr:hypothetical protein RF11_09656 [Thelohanellus kitauei]